MRTEAPYVTTLAMAAALAVIFLGPVGCSPREEAAPAPPSAAPPPRSSPPPVEPSSTPDENPTPTTELQQARPITDPAAPPDSTSSSLAATSELPAAKSPASTGPPSAAPPSPPAPASPPPAAPPSPPAPASPPPAAPRLSDSPPAPGAEGVVDPGGEIAVEATRPGLTRIGAAKCGKCHKPQYASWSESAHARRDPPLDCEGCHGAGSEYKSLAVMKDTERAKAAGLVEPNATFCATCHRQGWNDDLLEKAHAHKEPPKS